LKEARALELSQKKLMYNTEMKSMEKSKIELSGAVQTAPEQNQRWGETIGTIKIYEEQAPTNDKMPVRRGYIIISQQDVAKIKYKEYKGKQVAYLPIALWDVVETTEA
jgi:hypothetical protein